MTAARLRVLRDPFHVEAEKCPDCRALLPPCDTEDRAVHLDRCRRLTQMLALSEPPTAFVMPLPGEPHPPADREPDV